MIAALALGACSSDGGGQRAEPEPEAPECAADGDCTEDPDRPWCRDGQCAQCRSPHHCASLPGTTCLGGECVAVDAGGGGGADAGDSGGAPPVSCLPVESRPYDEPEGEVQEWPVADCPRACTGHDMCMPPGLCQSRCEAPLPCAGDSMRRLKLPNGGEFDIDAYEASRPDADEYDGGCARYGRVCSHRDAIPWSGASWEEAADACMKVGKRLCTLDEWVAACRGACNFDFPYGEDFIPGACNDGTPEGRRGLEPAGKNVECSTPEWDYDLVGNLREWTGSEVEPGKYAVVGGSSKDTSHLLLGCSKEPGRYIADAADARPELVGFRCCKSVR